ncbi:hypothetical protein J2Z43_000344 [Clostridioides mangenotii]|uniref:DUF4363 family protein n=1 Tax=Metaclostridioides mangenotii TaxID=1540 RepID=A0ABS4E7Q0_9FIRM|nr:hypothetical protein [Clostridioides mangenotii]
MVIIIKSTVFAVVWTVLFLIFGVYISNSVIDVTDKYQDELTKIEHYIDEDKWDNAKENTDKVAENWKKEKSNWYKILDHASFNMIDTYLNILNKAIIEKDKVNSYEQIENVKSHISNIKGNVNYGPDYIF